MHFSLSPSDRQLKAVHIETYGKTGCRRIVPGQYLAADPQGRAIMISAVEKQKLVRGPVCSCCFAIATYVIHARFTNCWRFIARACGLFLREDAPMYATEAM